MAPSALLLAAALAAALCAPPSRAAPLPHFPIFEPCAGVPGSGTKQGLCRRAVRADGSDPKAAGGRGLAIDMRFPCSGNATCDENIDVAPPVLPPVGKDVASCSVQLMPWSPFPCSFNTASSFGVEGQPSDLCYTAGGSGAAAAGGGAAAAGSGAAAAGGGAAAAGANKAGGGEAAGGGGGGGLAVNLTTDGYTNLFHGRFPAYADQLCGLGSGGRLLRLHLTFDFRVAAGRQFDRTSSFQIGGVVVGFGTLAEPFRANKSDKRWSTTVDATHLQNYLAPGLPTRFRLDNVLSNTYNVPLWASVTLTAYYTPGDAKELHKGGSSDAARGGVTSYTAGAADAGDGSAAAAAAPAAAALGGKAASGDGAATAKAVAAPAAKSAAVAAKASLKEIKSLLPPGSAKQGCRSHMRQAAITSDTTSDTSSVNTSVTSSTSAAADVPDEVVPLVPEASPGVPAAESLATLAGTGGWPAHWPNVTFKLRPVLSEPGNIYRAQVVVTPKANFCEEFWAMNPSGNLTGSTCGGKSTGEPYREVRAYLDGQLVGFSPIRYVMYSGGIDPRLWSAIIGQSGFQLPSYTFDLGPWLGQLNRAVGGGSSGGGGGGGGAQQAQAGSQQRQKEGQRQQQQEGQQQEEGQQHTITVDLFGATGADWHVANVLHLWRAPGLAGRVTSLRGPHVTASPDLASPVTSRCAGDVSAAANCTLAVANRSLAAGAELDIDGERYVSFVRYDLSSYTAVTPYNNTAGYAGWWQETGPLETVWALGKADPRKARRGAAASAAAAGAAGGPGGANGKAAAGGGRAAGSGGRKASGGWHRKLAAAGGGGSSSSGSSSSGGGASGPLDYIITQRAVRESWSHIGGMAAGHPFVFSANMSHFEPAVWAPLEAAACGGGGGRRVPAMVTTGDVAHYQRAVMVNVYDPSKPGPLSPSAAVTHTASLNSSLLSVASGRGGAAAGGGCVAWRAAAVFGASGVAGSELDTRCGGGLS